MSELSELLTYERFQIAIDYFINQCEKNMVTGRSNGITTLVGVPNPNPEGKGNYKVDGECFGQKFGQGAASRAPHLNWHVVSIYYVVSEGRFVLAIQKKRYKHMSEMHPIGLDKLPIGGDNEVAIFYETDKLHLSTKELYDNFMKVCEEVRVLGTEVNNGYIK